MALHIQSIARIRQYSSLTEFCYHYTCMLFIPGIFNGAFDNPDYTYSNDKKINE
jgi:hypothetical protein